MQHLMCDNLITEYFRDRNNVNFVAASIIHVIRPFCELCEHRIKECILDFKGAVGSFLAVNICSSAV